MARGKQAAASARRKADRAEARTDEVKSRLQTEREQAAQEINDLRAEVNRLKNDHLLEAQRLAAEEIGRINAEHAETKEHLRITIEAAKQIMDSKDYLVANACRYISMTIGDTPMEALDMVITWMTGEDYTGNLGSIESALDRLALPPDGWVATIWKRNKHLNPLWDDTAISLENAEKMGHDRIHKDYDPKWYADAANFSDINKLRRGDRKTGKSGVAHVAATRFVVHHRSSSR